MERINGPKWISKTVITILAIASFACGGGGDSGGGGGGGGGDVPFPGFTPASTSIPMTVDQGSAAMTASMMTFAHNVGGMMGPNGTYLPLAQQQSIPKDKARQASASRTILNQIKAHVGSKGYAAAGADSDSAACSNGGSYSISYQFSGDYPVDACDLNNLYGTMVLQACWIDENTMLDGVIDFQFTGDACTPSNVDLQLTNFTLAFYDGQLLTSYLDINGFDLLWTNGFIYSGTTVLNGQAIGEDPGGELAVAFYDFTETANTYLGDDYYYYTSLDIHGGLTGPCLDGWAYVETYPEWPIVLSDGLSCPIDGQVTVYGQGSMDMIYYYDGSVLVGEDLYDTCIDTVDICPL